jgi:tetratricopeptide (TPR) repeat protein
MKNIFLLFFTLSFSLVNAQICDTMDVKKTEHLAKVYQKCKERTWEKKDIGITDPDELFDIATYLRQKNDTLYKVWYKNALTEYKKTGDIKNSKKKAKHLYRVGLCYFYTEQYAEAETWFKKAIAAKYYNSCDHYYYSFTLKKLGKEKEAEEQFKVFKEETKNIVQNQD